jgi:hypothetical protein
MALITAAMELAGPAMVTARRLPGILRAINHQRNAAMMIAIPWIKNSVLQWYILILRMPA